MDVEAVSCPDCNGERSYYNTEVNDHIPPTQHHRNTTFHNDACEHIDPCDYCHGKGMIDEPKEDTAYANGECNWS